MRRPRGPEGSPSCGCMADQADLTTMSMCEVSGSRSGRGLRYAGITIACPTRSRSESSTPLPNSDFETRVHAQPEAVTDAEVPVVEQVVYVTAQQQVVVDAMDATVLGRA